MNKDSWEVKKLGEVCNFSQGIQIGVELQYSESNSNRSRFLRISDYTIGEIEIRYVDNTNEKYYVNEDDLVIVRYGASAGFVGRYKYGILANNLFKLNHNKDILISTYLYYCLSTQYYKNYIVNVAFGAAMPALSFKSMSNYEIPIPPLAIQEQIVAELDALNDILDKKRQQLKELDSLAQATFYDIFGDPVENEKGWEVRKLETLVTKLGDGIHGTPNYTDDGEYYFINGNNLKNGKIVITPTTKRVSKEEAEFHKRELTNNTVFVSINGTIGNIAFYNNEKIMLGKSVCYFNLKMNHNKIFIYSLFKTDYFLNYAMGESTGSTIKNVSLRTMRNFLVPLSPLSLQNQFAEQIEAIEKQKELISQSINEVENLFNYTMDKYFN